jgi:hypothetical protein
MSMTTSLLLFHSIPVLNCVAVLKDLSANQVFISTCNVSAFLSSHCTSIYLTTQKLQAPNNPAFLTVIFSKSLVRSTSSISHSKSGLPKHFTSYAVTHHDWRNLQLQAGLDIPVILPVAHLHQVIKVGDLPVDPLLCSSSGPEEICRRAAAVVTQVRWPETQDSTEHFVASL